MPVTGPRKSPLEKSLPPQTEAEFPKQEFLHVLHRAGIPQETIKEADEQLHDPVDPVRDGIFLVRHGIDRDQLVSLMGGSS
jgi:hypothetical protein